MKTNIVCSDTYIAAFAKLDKTTQKKSLDTIRSMQRGLKNDSLKVEKLNTKLDFKSARVTQDFRVIFTQSGNTILLVYIARHDAAYLWASRRLQGFDAADAKPAYEYFEKSKKVSDTIVEDVSSVSDSIHSIKASTEKRAEKKSGSRTNLSPDSSVMPVNNQISDKHTPSGKQNSKNWLMIAVAFISFLLGILTGLSAAIGYLTTAPAPFFLSCCHQKPLLSYW